MKKLHYFLFFIALAITAQARLSAEDILIFLSKEPTEEKIKELNDIEMLSEDGKLKIYCNFELSEKTFEKLVTKVPNLRTLYIPNSKRSESFKRWYGKQISLIQNKIYNLTPFDERNREETLRRCIENANHRHILLSTQTNIESVVFLIKRYRENRDCFQAKKIARTENGFISNKRGIEYIDIEQQA